MRILNPCCGIAPGASSGGEVHEREILRHLPVHGVEPLVFLAPGKAHPPEVTVRRWAALRHLRWWSAPLLLAPEITWAVKIFPEVRLIRAHSLRYLGMAAVIAGRRAGLPVVVQVHHLDGGALAWLDQWVIRRADLIVADSRFTARQVAEVGAQKVAVVPCGTDIVPAAPRSGDRARLGLGGPVALFLGELKPRKNVGFLLRVWGEVAARVPSAVLLVAGDGPERRRLQHLARQLGIEDRVRFFGRVPEADKPMLYALADVFLFPSLLEGFGMPVLDAMVSGVPALVSCRGALPELAEVGPLGVIPLENDDEWVDETVELLKNPGRHQGVQGMTWDRAASQMAAALRGIA